MVFSSVTFLFAFLPATLLGYYVLPRSWRIAFLLLVSLVFYAWGEPVYVLLMMGSILINWCIGLLMERFERRKRALLVLAVVIDLAMLAVFKYASFLMRTVAAIVPAVAGNALPDIRLPIGISFFTFQILSYIIDVYRGDARTQKNLVRFGAYVSMFPQLIAGPIVRIRISRRSSSGRRSPSTGLPAAFGCSSSALPKSCCWPTPWARFGRRCPPHRAKTGCSALGPG